MTLDLWFMNFINVLILYTAVENECSKSLEKWKYVWDHLPTKSEPMSLLWKWPVLMNVGRWVVVDSRIQ